MPNLRFPKVQEIMDNIAIPREISTGQMTLLFLIFSYRRIFNLVTLMVTIYSELILHYKTLQVN